MPIRHDSCMILCKAFILFLHLSIISRKLIIQDKWSEFFERTGIYWLLNQILLQFIAIFPILLLKLTSIRDGYSLSDSERKRVTNHMSFTRSTVSNQLLVDQHNNYVTAWRYACATGAYLHTVLIHKWCARVRFSKHYNLMKNWRSATYAKNWSSVFHVPEMPMHVFIMMYLCMHLCEIWNHALWNIEKPFIWHFLNIYLSGNNNYLFINYIYV